MPLQKFKEEHKNYTCDPRNFTLKKIRNQSPQVYDADKIMRGKHNEHAQEIRCDYFVLSNHHDITGIYVIECKKRGKNAHISNIKKQLQSGADFISGYIDNDNDAYKFVPILVAKSGVIPSYRHGRNAQRKFPKITLDKYPAQEIQHIRINAPLPNIIKK